MKATIEKIILFTLTFTSYWLLISSNEIAKEKKPVECPTVQRQFGDVRICLPKIINYTECYENIFVRERADKESLLLKNEMIGVYLTNSLFTKFQKEPYKTVWLEHIKIYGNPQLKNKNVPSTFFIQVENRLRMNSEVVPWDIAVKSINESNIGFTMEKPALIEIYQPNKKIKSIIYLADINYSGEARKIIWTVNMCIIKNRLIYFCYYMNFNNSEARKILKIKSDSFGEELIKLNI